MKLVVVSGMQGSGRTTLIRELIARVGAAGKRSAVIVNEDGEATYDEDFARLHGVTVERLRGGWLGCSLAASFVARVKQIRSTADEPDYLFVEPSSQVVTHELQSVSAMALRDVSYEVGPLITLVDGPMFDVWWQERRELLLGQIADADLVAVSQADLLEPGQVERVRNKLNAHAERLLALSTLRGWGVEDILARIT